MDSRKVVEIVQLIVRKELNKTLKPMLKEVLKPLVKEMVNGQVNAILAERYLAQLAAPQQVVNEMRQVATKQVQAPRQVISSEQRKKEFLKKMGIEDDPIASTIYGDIDVDQVISESTNGVDPTGEDEGYDLAQFGF
jgi:hypothetical protein